MVKTGENRMPEKSNPPPIRVFGLSESEQQSLRLLAVKKYGKDSLSLLAKKTLQTLLAQECPQDRQIDVQSDVLVSGSNRITLRLPETDRRYLHNLSAIRQGSINDAARDIIQMYIRQHPVPSDAEIRALYQSNTQLAAIGRNLNQIAHRLNAGESASLSARMIADLENIIRSHIAKTGNVIRAHREQRDS